MILAIALVAFLIFVLVRRAKRKRAIQDMQLRPYRYPVETRSSRFTPRGGF